MKLQYYIILTLATIYVAIIHTWLSNKDKRKIKDVRKELAG